MDKTLLGLMMIFFLAFTIFITFVVFNEQFTSAARASNQIVSPDKSLVFAWPLALKADGKTESEVRVFIRDEDGKAVADRPVRLESSMGTVKEASVSTDNQGLAVFHMSSNTPGVAEIQSFVDNSPIRKKVSIKFE